MLGFKNFDKSTYQSKLVESTIMTALRENEVEMGRDLTELEKDVEDTNYIKAIEVVKESLSIDLPADENMVKSINDKYNQAVEISKNILTVVKKRIEDEIKVINDKVVAIEKDEKAVDALTRYFNKTKLDSATEDEFETKLLPFGYVDKEDFAENVQLDVVKVLYDLLNVPYNVNIGETKELDVSLFAGHYLREDSLNIIRNISNTLIRNFPEFMEFDESGNPTSDDGEVVAKCAKSFIEDVEELEEFINSATGEMDINIMDAYMTIVMTVEKILTGLLKFKDDYESGEFMKRFPETNANNINVSLAILILLLERACFLYNKVFSTCISFIKERTELVEIIVKEDK